VVVVLLLGGGEVPSDTRRVLAVGVFLLAAATDRLDGLLARRSGTVTRFGIVADPIADKGLLGAAFVCAAVLGDLWWWVVVVVLVREVGVTVLRLVVVRRGLLPATRGGKTKTVLQVVTAAAVLLPLPQALDPVVTALVLVMIAVTLVTGGEIVYRAAPLIRSSR
jgi:CDP-diacylglycerol--glycerol-3-phosphate 3-phosphatidyltransferase